jgi:hypothetical protein
MLEAPLMSGGMVTDGDTMHVGTRSTGYMMEPTRPGDGTSRSWSRDIGDYRYSFTLVNMPSGEVRWFVSRYDKPISQYEQEGSVTPESLRMRFGAYWHPYREWTFKPTD